MRQNIILSLLIGGLSQALFAVTTPPLDSLRCSSVIESDLSIQVLNENTLTLRFEDRGRALRKLLHGTFAANISRPSVANYDCLELRLNLPTTLCKFNQEHPELVSCKGVGLRLPYEILARPSCYKDEGVIYAGSFSAIDFATQHKNMGRDFLQWSASLTLDGQTQSISVMSKAYHTQPWQYDGLTQNPECIVNGEYLSVVEQ